MGLQIFSFVDDDIVCKSPYLFAALWPVYIGIIVFSCLSTLVSVLVNAQVVLVVNCGFMPKVPCRSECPGDKLATLSESLHRT